MKEKDKQIIAFYKNSAFKLLKQLEFTKEEKELIHLAISTAKSSHPNMKLIYQADEIFKKANKTKKPISPSNDKDTIKEIAIIDFMFLEFQDKIARHEIDFSPNYNKAKIYTIIILFCILLYLYFFAQNG